MKIWVVVGPWESWTLIFGHDTSLALGLRVTRAGTRKKIGLTAVNSLFYLTWFV